MTSTLNSKYQFNAMTSSTLWRYLTPMKTNILTATVLNNFDLARR